MTRPRRHDDAAGAAAAAATATATATAAAPGAPARRAGHRGQHVLRTASSAELSAADIDALAAEAEAGYDVDRLRPRPARPRPPAGEDRPA